MENKFEPIESYLAGEMSIKEQLAFEELLRKDRELMLEFKLRKSINNAINENDVMELRESLSNITSIPVKKKPIILNPYIITTAAAIIIFAIVSSLYLNNRSYNTNDLFNQYYKKYPSIINSRSIAESEKEQLFIDVFNYYDDNNYENVILTIKELLKTNDNNSLLLFYLSVSLMEQNELKQSEHYLKQLVNNKNHVFWEQSHWYLALNLIKQNDKFEAIRILKVIVDEDMSKRKEAEKLIKILE